MALCTYSVLLTPFKGVSSSLQLFDTGGDVLLFYNERTMGTLVKAMSQPGAVTDPASDTCYHINLICLLAMCTEGKNDTTEIKCHCLLPLYDVVCIITHKACIPEVRTPKVVACISSQVCLLLMCL